MDFVQTEEGRAIKSGSNWNYEYTLTDHLGNSRVNIDSYNGAVRVTQEDEYYPFGLDRQRYTNGIKNKYLYNKKEFQEELGQYDYGARSYDPVIARMTSIDPSARSYVSLSPYSYVNNNPIGSIDPDGRDLIVLNATSHVFHAGHAAVLIGNPKTGYRYYAKNGTTEHFGAYGKSNVNPVKGKHFASLKEFEGSKDNKQDGPYDRTYDIKTDEATDKNMEAAALAAVESDYNVLDQSCIDVASDALSAGKLNPGDHKSYNPEMGMDRITMSRLPNWRFDDIVRNNPGGILLIFPQPKKEQKATITIEPLSKPKFIPNDPKQN